jgi:hypothetical protein
MMFSDADHDDDDDDDDAGEDSAGGEDEDDNANEKPESYPNMYAIPTCDSSWSKPKSRYAIKKCNFQHFGVFFLLLLGVVVVVAVVVLLLLVP